MWHEEQPQQRAGVPLAVPLLDAQDIGGGAVEHGERVRVARAVVGVRRRGRLGGSVDEALERLVKPLARDQAVVGAVRRLVEHWDAAARKRLGEPLDHADALEAERALADADDGPLGIVLLQLLGHGRAQPVERRRLRDERDRAALDNGDREERQRRIGLR